MLEVRTTLCDWFTRISSSNELSPEIRPLRASDRDALLELAGSVGLFDAGQLDFVAGMIDQFLDGTSAPGHRWFVLVTSVGLEGVAYIAPEAMTDGTWNLLLIAVSPQSQGKGLGTLLVRFVESLLRAEEQRILLVETSGLDTYRATRSFYLGNGFVEQARIPEYYSAGQDKVVFWKRLED